MSSCLVPLNEYFTSGAITLEDSEVNFIGNVSFEGNHAVARGGKGKFEDALSAVRGA